MKINEKSLSSYAFSQDGIDKEGMLLKKGAVNHSYKKRWFVLKGNLLFYFEKQFDRQPIGMIILENCSVEVSDTERYSFCIRYQAFGSIGATRTYILCADSESDMEQWMKAITAASYCFADMVVKEFEKTLERLKSTDDNSYDNNCNNLQSQQQTLLNLASGDNNNINNTSMMEVGNLTKTTGVMPAGLVKSTSSTDVTDSSRSKRTATASGKLQRKISGDIDVTCKTKPPYDMYTITNLSNVKSKFKTLNPIRRSKSSENVNNIFNNSNKSPNPKRKSRVQTIKRPNTYVNTSLISDTPLVAYEFEKTTFEILHTSFGAAIWTRIGETL